MRTIEEIKKRFEYLNTEEGGMREDPFAFRRENLGSFVKEYLNDGVEPDPLTVKNVTARMREYMEFAMGKALNHRGLSANRSLMHFETWLWLLGDDEMLSFAEDDKNFPNYGMPVLKAISRKYGFPIPEDAEAWIDGKKCRPDCQEGCDT